MNRLLDQLPMNTLRNNMTGQTYQFQSGGMPDNVDYARPLNYMGKKAFYGKQNPADVFDENGNKIASLIGDVAEHNRQQDRAYQLQKRKMEMETEALQQKKIKQELDSHGRAPANYRFKTDGTLEPIPGGPADVKEQGKFNADLASMQGTESAMNSLAEQANMLLKHKGLDAATGWQSLFPSIPGGDAKNFEALLDTLRSKTAFGTLQAMRDASKTGGALGAVSEKELKLLESNLAALDKAQSPEQFRAQLEAIIKYAEGAKGRTREAFNMTHTRGAQPQQQSAAQLISEAQNAIMKNAPREAVIQRLESMGITNHGL